MSRLAFRLLHWFWLLASPTYRAEIAQQRERQRRHTRRKG